MAPIQSHIIGRRTHARSPATTTSTIQTVASRSDVSGSIASALPTVTSEWHLVVGLRHFQLIHRCPGIAVIQKETKIQMKQLVVWMMCDRHPILVCYFVVRFDGCICHAGEFT